MKGNSVSRGMPVLMIICGIAALLLRKSFYEVAVDVKGLLLRNHPLELAAVGLTAVVLAVIALSVRKLKTSCDYEDHHSASLLGGIGHVAAGAGILVTVLTGATAMNGYVVMIWRCLGLVAPVGLAAAGVARALGKRPFLLLYVAACLFFAVHTVSRYQLWSGNPQMQDYLFALLGVLALMFFSYYSAAWDAGWGNLRMTVGIGLAAIYLCIAELAGSGEPALYLGGAVWALTELCSLRNGDVSEEREN